ncbi:hypothetical protein [Dietzia sp. 179-F 9C3 NHS]|uniref:hypothetical protein n=1 Tax=Dietzia sp. 179-F 9C3 NHS TaxID=3374295 RepID=UPI003879F340
MTTVTLESIGMGPLSDLLEQWWATVEVTEDGYAPTRVRISISWSPMTNQFTPESDGSTVEDVGAGGHPVEVDAAISAFLASPERERAYKAFRAHARRHREDFPERVAVMESSR